MAKLYPPMIEGAIPAFSSATGLSIPYQMNRAVGYGEISGFALVIKSTITNKTLVADETTNIITPDKINFSYNSSWGLKKGTFYKVQIAFLNASNEIGYYSNVGIVKFIGEENPVLEVKDDTSTANTFIGSYTCKDITEKLYSYKFSLYDMNGKFIDGTGELLHNASKDVGTTQYDSWMPTIGLDNGSNYELKYSVTTINDFKLTKTQVVTAKKDEQGYAPRGIEMEATLNRENGYVSITIGSKFQNDTRELMYGNFQIFKTSSKDNFQSKYLIAYFSLQNQDLFEKEFKDFTVESGYTYNYILQQVNDYGIYSEEVYAKSTVEVYFDYLFLFDGKKQLKIKYNPKVSSFKNTILESKTDTIGSQYPFIFRNGTVKYKEFNISGLISYQMDEENLFLKDHEIWTFIEKDLDGTYLINKSQWTHNLTDQSINAERIFKLKVMDWLNNGEVKLFRSPTEGNYLVRLMNISMTPNDTLGRMLHTFSATGYEIEEASKHSFAQAITVDRSNKYIGYRTIPLYDFPLTKIAIQTGEGTDSKYTIINNNRLYEIIGNPALEYVVAARFEDVKPWTKFNIVLERGLEVFNLTITIGATGFYAIPRELGFHIKSIKLVESDWVTGDANFDIINNRGQVTYEFERQAKHNNFNDITKINAGIAVSKPWYSSWYQAIIQEPILNSEGKQVYAYSKGSTQDAYIEMAYFDGKLNPLIRGIDYEVEKGSNNTDTYIGLGSYTGETLKKNNERGCPYSQGDAIYKFKPAQKLSGVEEDSNISSSEFQWEQQVAKIDAIINNNDNLGYYCQYYSDKNNINNNITPLYYFDCVSNNGFFEINDDNKEVILNVLDGKDQSLITRKGEYQRLDFSKAPLLFVPEYNSQGNQLYSYIVTKEKEIRNPYYVKIEYAVTNDDLTSGNNKYSNSTEAIQADNYKITPLYVSSETLGEDSFNPKNLPTDTIYKNYVPNKFYNNTNVNGEYYIKEDMLNLYNLNFELIQVFYEENLEGTQNFEFDGNVIYKDTYEDTGYQYTTRMVSGLPKSNDTNDYSQFLGADLILGQDEMFADIVEFTNHDFVLANNIYNINSISESNSGDMEAIEDIFNVDLSKYSTEDDKVEFWINQGIDLYVFDDADTKVEGGKYLRKMNTGTGSDDYNKDIYLNVRLQASKNYSQITTPGPNEIIIVYDDALSQPVRIDLTEKFSYSIAAPDKENGFNNIVGIYIGKNVRGFATYKRKLYDYHALVEDGVYIDLKSSENSLYKESEK